MHPVPDVDFLGDRDLAGLAAAFQSHDRVVGRDFDQRRDLRPGHLMPDAVALLEFPPIHEYVEMVFFVRD